MPGATETKSPALPATAIAREFTAVAESLEAGRNSYVGRAQIADLERDNVAFLEAYEQGGGGPASRLSTRIARDQLVVVAIVRDPRTRRVEQAVQFDLADVAAEAAGR